MTEQPTAVTPELLEQGAGLAIDLVYASGSGDHGPLDARRAGDLDVDLLGDLAVQQVVVDQMVGMLVGTVGELTTWTANRAVTGVERAELDQLARLTHLVLTAVQTGDLLYRNTALGIVRALTPGQLDRLQVLTLAACTSAVGDRLGSVGWQWADWRQAAYWLLGIHLEGMRRDRGRAEAQRAMALRGIVN